jgi:hypothetical protein
VAGGDPVFQILSGIFTSLLFRIIEGGYSGEVETLGFGEAGQRLVRTASAFS